MSMDLTQNSMDTSSGSPVESPPTSPDSESGWQRVEDLWFDNGTLVLLAESSMFRVYKSILTIRSTVLRDVLSHPDPHRLIEACPIVALDDSADDLTYFLRAIYRPEFFETAQELEFPVLAGVLRLSTKYNVKGLRQIALSHLLNAYPTTIDAWDKRDTTLSFAPEECPPMAVLQLVKEFDIASILPTVMYCCSIRSLSDILDGMTWNESQFALSPTDQRTCLIARQALVTAKRRNISSFLNAVEGISVCNNRAACNTGRLRAVFTNKDDSDSCDPLWDGFDWDAYAASVCSTCLAGSKASFRHARSTLWADVPVLFNLPKWAVLSKATLAPK